MSMSAPRLKTPNVFDISTKNQETLIKLLKEEVMKVSELIEFLKTQPQDILVAYGLYSEQCLMDSVDIGVEELCNPRPDGWIQDKRPDMPTQKYLVFPGN